MLRKLYKKFNTDPGHPDDGRASSHFFSLAGRLNPVARGGALVLALLCCGVVGVSCYVEGRTTPTPVVQDAGETHTPDETPDETPDNLADEGALQVSNFPEVINSNCELFSLMVSLTNTTDAPLNFGAEDGYMLDLVYYTEKDENYDGEEDVVRVGGGMINVDFQLPVGATRNITFRPFNILMVDDVFHNTNGFENLDQPIDKQFGVLLWHMDGPSYESNKFHIETTGFTSRDSCPDNTEDIQAIELN